MDIPLGYILVKKEQYQEFKSLISLLKGKFNDILKENAELRFHNTELRLHNEELSKMLKKYEED